jgi:hypothetical protein
MQDAHCVDSLHCSCGAVTYLLETAAVRAAGEMVNAEAIDASTSSASTTRETVDVCVAIVFCWCGSVLLFFVVVEGRQRAINKPAQRVT